MGADDGRSTPGPLLPELFETRAARVPDAIAVVHDGETVAYRELEARANRLARLLIRRGAGPGRLVAVLQERSPQLVVTLLAVLKSGAGYVPLAVDDPPRRAAYILEDSAAPLVVAAGEQARAALREVDGPAHVVWLDDADVDAQVCACPDHAVGDEDRLRPLTRGDCAYVIYTSGTSGRPKGVVIDHGALSAYLDYACTRYPAVGGRTLLHSSVSFDMAVTSLYAPLITGGTIEILDLLGLAGGAPPPAGFAQPTFLKVTPSHLALLRRLPDSCSPSEMLVIGGEALLGASLDAWRADHPGVTVVNEYGPTEAAVGCCVYVVRPGARLDPGPVPIGVPTEDTQLYVCDDAGRPAADGDTGELYIAGAQLARGYLNRPELTAERFVENHSGAGGSRVYRTGDLVRRRPDGNLEYLGRADDQVKIDGYRVELGEIEAVLCGSDAVSQAAVIPRAGADARPVRLAAYVVGAHGSGFDPTALRRWLSATLPAYMIPADFVSVAEIPLTANGKLDRARLLEHAAEQPEPEPAPAQTSDQRLLCRLVQEIVGAERVGVDDDFLAIGGSSIAAARLVSRARKAGLCIGLMDVLRKRTVREILTG